MRPCSISDSGFNQRVADNLRRLREARGLTRIQTAAELKMPPTSISNHESGLYAHRFDVIVRYARLYNILADDLAGGPLPSASKSNT